MSRKFRSANLLGLAGVISPESASDFLAMTLSNKFLYVPGPESKFRDLLTWSDLNRLLTHNAFTPSRLRLTKAGVEVPHHLFTNTRQELVAATLADELRDGATLIMNGIDLLHEPITSLADDLERDLRSRVSVNMYAGWRTVPGFDLHWDEHDVFILQIAGRKQWQIHGITHKFPIDHRLEKEKCPPSTGPLWEQVLSAGDMLYIPRGWWHVAIPCDEPTIHLTVGFTNSTGLNLLKWIADQLVQNDHVRMDLPIFQSGEARTAYLESFKKLLVGTFDQGDLLDQFFRSSRTMSSPRTRFSLPWSATPEILPQDRDFVIWLEAPRGLEISTNPDENILQLKCDRKMFVFPLATDPLFERLEQSPLSIEEFLVLGGRWFPESDLLAFLSDLVKHGIVSLLPPRPMEPSQTNEIDFSSRAAHT